MTVYVRRLTDAKLTAEAALADALAGVKELESRGMYSDVKIYTVDPSKAPAGWSTGGFTAKIDGEFAVSFIYCQVRPGVLFKVRATTNNPDFAKLMGDVKLLLKAIDRDGKKS